MPARAIADSLVRIGSLYAIVVWCIVPTFFWFRGIRQGNNLDLLIAVVINIIVGILMCLPSGTTDGLNLAGYWFMAVSAVTIMGLTIFGRLRTRNAFTLSLAVLLLGFLFALLV
jgi:hypothetical protein